MNKYYNSCHTHTTYSLMDGLSQPEDIVKRCKEIGSTAVSINDHGTLAGTIEFLKECKKGDIKPIIGIEAYVSKQNASIKTPENREHTHLLLYAKNNQGWKTLLKINNIAQSEENFYYKGRLSIREIADFADGNISVVIGHIGTLLANLILDDDYDNSKALISFLCDKFGKENVWLEAQPVGIYAIPETRKILAVIRRLSKEMGIPAVTTPDAHFCRREDAELQRILLCKSLGGITLEQGKNGGMATFFTSDDWHIPTYDEMLNYYGSTEEELENTIKFADQITEYTNILSKPKLPNFVCPEGYNSNSWLRELCRNGWRSKIQDKIPKDQQQPYIDRIKHELNVFEGANLAGYFLIVEDIIRYSKEIGCPNQIGRGSVGGCLTAYLLEITSVDPIKYDLLFSRFYDESRKDSLMDIDMDFPKYKREQIVDYIKNRYGKENVAQIATYQTMKGRAALKDVFRAYGNMGMEEQNKITKLLPDPAKVAGELQEMEEEEGESSLIRYTLENDKKRGQLNEWCWIDDEGNLQGPLAKQFEQAIKMEGTKVAQSKHAAGVVISPVPLSEICPLTYDVKTKSQICSLSLDDIESVGLVKIDCLGLQTWDRLMSFTDILQNNEAC